MNGINHTGRKHAQLSASGSSRWLNCPGSIRLEEKFYESNPRKSSTFADEGTLAHELSDISLRAQSGEMDNGTYKKELARIKKHKLYSAEMTEHVTAYVDYILARIKELEEIYGDVAELHIETKLDYSRYVPGGFGTGDTIIVCDTHLEVIDLKYGAGVKVDADQNTQLSLYAVGALQIFKGVKTVAMTIYQPRMDNVSTWEEYASVILDWAETVAAPAAKKALGHSEELNAGSHCKWCAVKPVCKALASKNMELAKLDFKEPNMLTDEEIAEVYRMIPMLSDWAKSVKDYMLEEAAKGKKFPGYKVVEGKSNRAWNSEKEYAVLETLEKLGLESEDYLESKLLSPTQMEKLVGKEHWVKLTPYVVKPTGSPTLAPDSDKRKDFGASSAQKDFAE